MTTIRVAVDTVDDAVEARRRKMFALAKEITLTREERLQFSEMLLRRDTTTWKDLTDDDRRRLLDALEGYMLIDVLLSLRPPST